MLRLTGLAYDPDLLPPVNTLICQWRENLEVALSYQYLDLGDARTKKSLVCGTLSGDYSDNSAQSIAISIAKSF